MQKIKNKYCKSSRKVPKQKNIQVLLDSGSDGDLMFHKKGTPKSYPYLMRQVPKSWSTSNGNFQTKRKGRGKEGSIQVKFLKYSNSKTVIKQLEIVEYKETSDKPAFDLIIGTKTMNDLGIILDF